MRGRVAEKGREIAGQNLLAYLVGIIRRRGCIREKRQQAGGQKQEQKTIQR
jgi:hypothetical protein